jgi:tRNA G18 (ribose-2'-O)-methylase SpoU
VDKKDIIWYFNGGRGTFLAICIPWRDFFMKEKFVLILPSIRSGHNVGAMFRTADAAGVDKIYLTGYTAAPPHIQIDKVSLGAEKWVPWEKNKQTGRIIKRLKKQGFKIVALEQSQKSVNIFKWQPRFPIALIVGNEVRGISPATLRLCDKVVNIPMKGKKESLNVSIAAGVAIYHVSKYLEYG